ncbi:MAG: hypothetical protein IPM51_12610 [Sphingobacteriaceae bacterium]|nr:hypothetical protein [Sphingobacteriaceae bacterium]
MKATTYIFLLLQFGLFAQTRTQNNKTYTIKGKVVYTNSYCGGVMPNKEVLDECNRAKPYVGKKLFVKKGESNNLKSKILFSFTVDSTGGFSFHLPKGNYMIVCEEQTKKISIKNSKNSHLNIDSSCYAQWWTIPLLQIHVDAQPVYDLQITFHKKCFVNSDSPCIHYSGPMPP